MSDALNDIALHIRGDRVEISGVFDLKGVARLQAVIEAAIGILSDEAEAASKNTAPQDPNPESRAVG